MLYVPWKVARHKLQGIDLAACILCFVLWPITMPVVFVYHSIYGLIVWPIRSLFRMMVSCFELSEDERKTIKYLPKQKGK